MTTVATTDARTDEGSPQVGATQQGRIARSDTVVSKIAPKAAAENPDAGGPATRVLGIPLPGVGGVGGHDSDLDGLPKTSVEVDGTQAFIELEISVQWPKSVAGVVPGARRTVRDRVHSSLAWT
jgi:uncharacterized alkaline shock family protein YloU